MSPLLKFITLPDATNKSENIKEDVPNDTASLT
jgi:hypothetical protein